MNTLLSFSRRFLPQGVVLAALVFALTQAQPSAVTSAPGPNVQAAIAQALATGLSSPAQSIEKEDTLLELESFWATRLTYPTGTFDQRWLIDSAKQDQAIPIGVPAGQKTYSKPQKAALTLNANSFTSLGPQPLEMDTVHCAAICFRYGNVSGRANVIIVDPVSTNIAYFGSDGGGVWKTTNCCTPLTTWTPVTDDPLLTTIAIDDLTIDPNDHNTVYAGTGDLNYGSFSFGAAGVLKSTDLGQTWTVLGADVFSPYYSEPVGQYPQYQAVGKVRVDPNNSSKVIAGTKTGVFISYDAGVNWAGPCPTHSWPAQRRDITGLLTRKVGNTTVLYAAVGARGFSTTVQYDVGNTGGNGIYSTTVPTSGCPANWNLISRPDNGWPAGTGQGAPFPASPIGRIDLAVAPSNPLVIYAQVATADGTDKGLLGFWRTTDGGVTWTQRSGNEVQSCNGFALVKRQQNWYDQAVAVDPNNADVVFQSDLDILRSSDGGATFTNLTCGYETGGARGTVHVDQHALAFVPGSSSTLLAGNDGGVYVSNDANVPAPTFNPINDSISTIEIYSGDITANFATSSSQTIVAGFQDNGSATFTWAGISPGPARWLMFYGGDGIFSRLEPKQGQRYYSETPTGALLVSTTGPQGPYVSAPGGWTADTRSFIFPYQIDRFNCPGATCDHLIAGSNRIWETIQGGTSGGQWYPNSPDLTKGTLADRSFINQLAYGVVTNTIAMAGTNDGNVQMGFGMGQGAANTATWVNLTGGNAVLPNRPVLNVAMSPANSLVGYAAVGGFDQNTPSTPGHVFQVTCTANCASFTWVNKTGNLPNIPVDSIIANPLFPQQVFAGTDWGLYFTDNINAPVPAWVRFKNGLPNAMIWDMTIDRGMTTLAVWTRSRGAYAWPLPSGPIGASPTPTTSPTATWTPGGPTATATRTSTPTVTWTPGGIFKVFLPEILFGSAP